MSDVIETRTKSIQAQVDNVLGFVKSPKGVFETADDIIKQFRSANRETINALTGEGSMRGLIEEKTRGRGGL